MYVNSSDMEGTLDQVLEKVELCIKKLSGNESLEDKIEINIKDNYIHRLERDWDSAEFGTLKEFKDKCIEKLSEYSDLHSKLPVYNDVQYHSREAAVKLGVFKFKESLQHLIELDKIIKSEQYVKVASSYNPDYETVAPKIKKNKRLKIN